MKALFIMVLLLLSSGVYAEKLVSAVSPEFPDGLQAQYIKYIARELRTELKILEMPYARRVRELEQGTIDMMVGVSNFLPLDGTAVARLHTPYESLAISLYVAKDAPDIATVEALNHAIVAVTRHTSKVDIYAQIADENRVEVSSLQQKIELLLKGRVQAFFHVQESAELFIDDMTLREKIKRATLQPSQKFEQYIAINKHSWLWDHKDEIAEIVEKGVAEGTFLAIRTQYYARKEAENKTNVANRSKTNTNS